MPEGVRDTFGEFQRNVRSVEKKLRLVRKRSSDVTPVELEGPFDLVFLDGDHSYAETKRDFELVVPLVAPTGVLAFHDSFCFEGVSRVVGEAVGVGRAGNLLYGRSATFPESFRPASNISRSKSHVIYLNYYLHVATAPLSLRPTLESIGRVIVPTGWNVELVVVDNGSTDKTRQVVNERATFPHTDVRYVLEPLPGQCHARNRGLAEAVGQLILFTDDDVTVRAR